MFLTNLPFHPAFNPILVNNDVTLRKPEIDDHQDWASLRDKSRDHLVAWEENWPPEELSLSAFKKRLRSYEQEMSKGAGLHLLIIRREDRRLLGGASLTNIRYGASRSGLLGYWLGVENTGHGYASSAVEALMRHAFEGIELNRLEAACQPENSASRKLLERCGFQEEGLAKEYLRINGRWRDHMIYAVTASSFKKP